MNLCLKTDVPSMDVSIPQDNDLMVFPVFINITVIFIY